VTLKSQTQYGRKVLAWYDGIRDRRWKNEQCRLPDATPHSLVVIYVSVEPVAFTLRVYSYGTIRRHIRGESHLVSRHLPMVYENTIKYVCWLISVLPSSWTRDLPNMMQEFRCLHDHGVRLPHIRHPQNSTNLYFSFSMIGQVLYPYKTCPEDRSKSIYVETGAVKWSEIKCSEMKGGEV
jgi:hypothetical protein